ncbi:SPX domain-containing protein [Gaertneriomyces semiglobifer]|nr:SPX domain-containing protein [Gaertneriomyces semiglobifer]
MKFGHHIATHSIPAWRPYYVSYKRLKQILKRLEKVSASHPVQTLTATPSTSTQAPEQEWTHRTIQDEFFKTLEEEVDKVEWFYLHKLDECQRMLEGLLVGWFWTVSVAH